MPYVQQASKKQLLSCSCGRDGSWMLRLRLWCATPPAPTSCSSELAGMSTECSRGRSLLELQSRYGNLYYVREEVRPRKRVLVFSWFRVLS